MAIKTQKTRLVRLRSRRPRRKDFSIINENSTNIPPAHVYFGENFIVDINDVFAFRRKVQSVESFGLVLTELTPMKCFSSMSLSKDSHRMKSLPNAGGNSVESEVLSYEMLYRCFGAQLHKTELEMSYFPEGGSITDYMCTMFETPLGVSVTRAMKYRGEFTFEDAQTLLYKKLKGVLNSTRNSLEKWAKQVLHIWATSLEVTRILSTAYEFLPQDLKANTVVLVTTAKACHDIF